MWFDVDQSKISGNKGRIEMFVICDNHCLVNHIVKYLHLGSVFRLIHKEKIHFYCATAKKCVYVIDYVEEK